MRPGARERGQTANTMNSKTGSHELLVKSFRDLRAWRRSMELVEKIYRAAAGSPQLEIYGLRNQLRRQPFRPFKHCRGAHERTD